MTTSGRIFFWIPLYSYLVDYNQDNNAVIMMDVI